MPNAVAALRADEWLEPKLAPILGTCYATASIVGQPLTDVWPALVLGIAALLPGAVFVSVVNDLTDLEDDRRAGKHNRLAGRSRRLAGAVIAACLAAGLAIGLLAWRDDAAAAGLYAAAWLAFSLYSVPPFRLKARGLAGALADAMGAHLFPHLLVALVVFREAGEPVAGWWLALVGAWSLALGVRGALLHQLGDVEADRRAGVRAFGALHPRLARQLGAFVAFPIELAAFGAMLVASGNAPAVCLLALYVALERMRVRTYGIRIAVVTPSPRARVAMQSYYVAIYPLAFLLTAAIDHPADALILGAHLLLFWREPFWIAREATRGRWIGQVSKQA